MDPKVAILWSKFYDSAYSLSDLKSDKGESLVNNLAIIIIHFVILSYKRFDDILTHDKDAYIKIQEKYRWKNLQKQSSDYLEFIDSGLRDISTLTPCLQGVAEIFNIGQYNKLIPAQTQREIIEIFTSIDLSKQNYSHDQIADFAVLAFETAEDWWAAFMNTPYNIGKLAVYLLKPQKGDYFYLPFCGIGDSLIATINYLRDKTPNSQDALETIKLYAEDNDKYYYAISALRLALSNIRTKIIENNDRFTKYSAVEQKPSIVFVDLYIADRHRFSIEQNISLTCEDNNFIVSKKFIDLYFLLHSLKKLDENGRMGILISKEILFAENAKKIRKWLVEKDYLEVVVSELEGPVLLILNKNKDVTRKGRVAFIKAKTSHDTDEYPLTTKEINRITEIYRSFETKDRKDVIVTLEDIRLLKYNLSPKYYTADLASAINLYGKDNISFVKLSELVQEIREDKPGINKTKYDSSLTQLIFEEKVLGRKDLTNNLSDPYIKQSNNSDSYSDITGKLTDIPKDSYISQKCILFSLDEISRLSSGLPAGLPTIFDPEKILKDTTFVDENTAQGKLFYTWLTPLIPKENKIVCEYLYYTLFVPFVYEQLLSASSIEAIKSILVPVHKSLKLQHAFLPALKQYILDLYEQKQKVIRGRLKAEDEKKEAEFQIIKHLAHSLNRRIGSVETVMTNLESFIQRKGLSGAALQEIHYEGQQPIIVKDKISVALNDLKQMYRVIKDTRALVTKEVKPEDFELVDLGELFKSHILTKYEGHNFHINFDCPPERVKVFLHKGSFIEAIDNIISNAEEHGFKNRENGNEIFFWIYDVGNEIIIDYANNGAKFPSDIKAAEFLEFGVRGKSSNGTGFGGAYVKLMLEAHNAKFEIINEEKTYWRLNKSGKMAVKKEKGFLNYSVYFRITIPQRRHYGQEN